jgi:DNA polymerase-3 subunit beta
VKEGDKKPIILEFTEGNCNLSIESPLGAMNEDIDIEKDGKDLTIGFNPRFMIDALKAIEDEDITLYMTNAKSPCFIRDDEDNYTYLVLPVNFTR